MSHFFSSRWSEYQTNRKTQTRDEFEKIYNDARYHTLKVLVSEHAVSVLRRGRTQRRLFQRID